MRKVIQALEIFKKHSKVVVPNFNTKGSVGMKTGSKGEKSFLKNFAPLELSSQNGYATPKTPGSAC